MRNIAVNSPKSRIARDIGFWLLVWLGLVIFYDQALKQHAHVLMAEHMVYAVQIVADIVSELPAKLQSDYLGSIITTAH